MPLMMFFSLYRMLHCVMSCGAGCGCLLLSHSFRLATLRPLCSAFSPLILSFPSSLLLFHTLTHIAAGDGDVYHWDLRRRALVHRFRDEGALHGVTLDLSADGRYLATGYTIAVVVLLALFVLMCVCALNRSDSGVVNVYDYAQVLRTSTAAPTPLKSLMNLTTSVHHVRFNPDAQVLAVASHSKQNNAWCVLVAVVVVVNAVFLFLRLFACVGVVHAVVHCVQNWPPSVRRCMRCSASPSAALGLLSVGNVRRARCSA